MDRFPITRGGYDSLRKELEHLKIVVRPENIKAIEEARAHGDLSENAEYHAAKERQGFISARIEELSYKIANSDIIDTTSIPKDKIVFGSMVVFQNIDTDEEYEYQLVGPDESDIEKGRLSINSPLGKALTGKKAGDEIVLNAPGGKRVYEILDIL